MRLNGRRLAAVLAMFLFTGGLLASRFAAAPTAEGYRHAMAAAPGDSLYAIDAGGRALVIDPAGGALVRGQTLGGLPLALSADGERLLLGTDQGLQWSGDGGRTWRRTGPAGRYPAVLLDGDTALGGAWAGSLDLSQDGGRTWRALPTPGAHEFEAIAASGANWFVATLTSVIVSGGDGRAWREVGPSRVTAFHADGAGVIAGTWRGEVLRLTSFLPPQPLADLHAGIWAVSGGLFATTAGLRGAGAGTPLEHAEVSALVASGPALYAGVARGPIYGSFDKGLTWQRVQG